MNFNSLNGRLIFLSVQKFLMKACCQSQSSTGWAPATLGPVLTLREAEGCVHLPGGSGQRSCVWFLPASLTATFVPLLSSAWGSLSLTQTPSGFGDQARVPQNLDLRDLTCVMRFFPPVSLSGCRRVQLCGRSFGRSEHQEAKSLFLPGRMLFLIVFNAYDLSAWISLLFTAPTEVEPDEWRLRPLHLVSMLFPLPHPLPSSASRCLFAGFCRSPLALQFQSNPKNGSYFSN